ncbi:MAG TPA: galactokinase family protein [Gemmatimonadaceae bacterium]|nr:galactokinase family protein [Gemmatimonadaceae bacterium]
MSEPAAVARAELFARAERALTASGVRDPSASPAFFVPGRIEVLGKHTDYAGGRSVLATVERGICLVAVPRTDGIIRVVDARTGDAASFPFEPALEPLAGHWSNYPMTVARRVAANFPGARRGADIAFASDLPPAAGMSSSSALMVATFFALAAVNEIERAAPYSQAIRSREDLAAYLGCIENGESFGALAGDRGVGTFGGSEDHVAMLCCEPATLSVYSFCPVKRESVVPFPAGHVFVVASSGVVAEKTGAARGAYNRAALMARAVLDQWNKAMDDHAPTLGALLARDADNAGRVMELLAEPALRDRFAQFVAESTIIIPRAAAALAGGDLVALGRLVDQSQRNAELLLGNQVPETIELARSARAGGAVAASAFGAGFGGSVWALVRANDADRFAAGWIERYLAVFPQHRDSAEVFVTRPGPAAMRLR